MQGEISSRQFSSISGNSSNVHAGSIHRGAFLLGLSIFLGVDRNLPDECPLIEDPRQANLIQYALHPSIGVYESPK